MLHRYECYKKGDYASASNPIPPELGGARQNDLSLIDFDESDNNAPPPQSFGMTSGAAPIDELASLFGPSPTASSTSQPQPQRPPMGSGIGSYQGMGSTNYMASTSNMGMSAPNPTTGSANGYNLGMGYGASSPPSFNQATRPSAVSPAQGPALGSIRLGTPSSSASTPMAMPNYFGNTTASPAPSMGMGMSMSSQGSMPPSQPQYTQQQQQQSRMFQQPQQQAAQQAPTNGTQGKDPFADLVGLF